MEELEKNMQSGSSDPSGKEQYELRKREREQGKNINRKKEKSERRREQLRVAPNKMGQYVVIAIIVAGGIFGIRALTQLGSNLPPTSQIGHTETSSSSHIMQSPMGDKTQRHMLEHADGVGLPGVIIQYNCKDYDCAADLVAQLTALVEEYPDNVYLAPNRYDGKIILTKEGEIEILDELDEQAIRAFIGDREVNGIDPDTPSL